MRDARDPRQYAERDQKAGQKAARARRRTSKNGRSARSNEKVAERKGSSRAWRRRRMSSTTAPPPDLPPEPAQEKPQPRFLENKLLLGEFIAVCALCATILLTNLFWQGQRHQHLLPRPRRRGDARRRARRAQLCRADAGQRGRRRGHRVQRVGGGRAHLHGRVQRLSALRRGRGERGGERRRLYGGDPPHDLLLHRRRGADVRLPRRGGGRVLHHPRRLYGRRFRRHRLPLRRRFAHPRLFAG